MPYQSFHWQLIEFTVGSTTMKKEINIPSLGLRSECLRNVSEATQAFEDYLGPRILQNNLS